MTGTNRKDGLQQWANIVVKMWEEKIVALQVWDEGALYHSFVNHVKNNAGGSVDKIDFLFSQYGIYADMGVGKETSRGNSGDVGEVNKRREPKPWYSKVFFREVMKLYEKTGRELGATAAFGIAQTFSDAFDQRFNDASIRGSTAKTVSSLKTVVYRDKSNKRWRNNYHSKGKFQWRSRNRH